MLKRVSLFLLLLCCRPLAAGDNQFSVTDSQSNFYSVTNRFNGVNDFVHVRKLNPNGSLLWENYRSPIGSDLRASAVAADIFGNLVIAAVRGRGKDAVMSVIRYRADGMLDWETDFNDNNTNLPTALALDRDGNAYVGGNSLRQGRSLARIWKYDNFGTVRWNREYGDFGNNYVCQLQLDIRGEVILGVETHQSVSAASGQYTLVTVVYDQGGALVSAR
ncbi:MAG: hypothetical protein HY922_14945 [Elusimicrobia bacterium]|nr:hypothetical protein [Elusimicrobiota bacterium]